ncbi:MAG: hypothetical protein A2Y82_01060 [Candidatus Buchananbacteria bacterium RBG_13_36_9]|uniref:Uncharacterized protein n=1 Tax=Candidatus Buchananbacteria bacterium RBG_13_36_9 TaxID=1797530 RepID=A0A1G1XPD6_9BACT|nr:MAG: hypothetical protein A2Y82_01060 [Candidatus Buchananbacteria bacterium RBG_13_36_9]
MAKWQPGTEPRKRNFNHWAGPGGIFVVIIFIVTFSIGVIVTAFVRDVKADYSTTTYKNPTILTVHESEKNFSGKIIGTPVIIKGTCHILVKPDGAKDDSQAYPATIDCASNPAAGDEVSVTDYTFTASHHLPDMVHIAEKTK